MSQNCDLPVSAPDSASDLPTAESKESSSCRDLATIKSRDDLNEHQRYSILTNKSVDLKSYPVNDQKRHYQHRWTENFEWICYSRSTGGIFCAPCFLFRDYHYNGEFVTTPFRDWKNATGKSQGSLYRHSTSSCHQQCLQQAVALISMVEGRSKSIKSHLIKSYDQQIEKNTKALLSIIDVIQYSIKQGLALRSNWSKVTKQENGNFRMLVDRIAHYNPDLQDHLLHSAKNAHY